MSLPNISHNGMRDEVDFLLILNVNFKRLQY